MLILENGFATSYQTTLAMPYSRDVRLGEGRSHVSRKDRDEARP